MDIQVSTAYNSLYLLPEFTTECAIFVVCSSKPYVAFSLHPTSIVMLIIQFYPIETDALSSPAHMPSLTSPMLVILKLKQGSISDF